MAASANYKLVCVAKLKGHDDRVWHAAWNPIEPLLATCSADKSIRIYTYSQNEGLLKFTHIHTIATGHSKTVRSLAWHPAGKILAAASFDSTVSMWERGDGVDFEDGSHDESPHHSGEMGGNEDWECVATIEGPESEIKGVGYSASGTLLATCSRDKSVWIWEVLPDHEHETISVLMSQHTQDVKCVTWHPSEEMLASGSYDDTIKLYVDDPSDDWYDFATLEGHSSTVWSLAFSPSGHYLASASDDLTIRIWTAGLSPPGKGQWQCCHVLRGHSETIYSVSWGVGVRSKRSLGCLASAGRDGKINVWDVSTTEGEGSMFISNQILATIESSHGVVDVNCVGWCPRKGYETLLVSTGDDGLAKIWQLEKV